MPSTLRAGTQRLRTLFESWHSSVRDPDRPPRAADCPDQAAVGRGESLIPEEMAQGHTGTLKDVRLHPKSVV